MKAPLLSLVIAFFNRPLLKFSMDPSKAVLPVVGAGRDSGTLVEGGGGAKERNVIGLMRRWFVVI